QDRFLAMAAFSPSFAIRFEGRISLQSPRRQTHAWSRACSSLPIARASHPAANYGAAPRSRRPYFDLVRVSVCALGGILVFFHPGIDQILRFENGMAIFIDLCQHLQRFGRIAAMLQFVS